MSSPEEIKKVDNTASSWHRHLQRLGLEPVTLLLQQKKMWEARQAQINNKVHLIARRQSESRHNASRSVARFAEHTVRAGETLREIAARYYGSNTRDKWLVIYEQNKGVIGTHPALIYEGQVLQIPVLV